MKTKNKKLLQYLLSSILLITLTACGGGDSKGSSGCNIESKDSDKDGFLDVNDLEPNKPFLDGKFANLENVVNSEGVKRILKIAKERDVTINFQLGNNPPKLKGYYRSEAGGRVVYAKYALVGGRTTGGTLRASERNMCMTKGFIVEKQSTADISITVDKTIRGDGQYFSTYYLNSKKVLDNCIAYYVSIRSGKVDKENGDIKNYKVIGATLGFNESKEGACRGAHISEEVFINTDFKKINDLDDLEYMCVDGDKAYIRGETWKNKDKESCKCTANVDIECE